MMSNLQMPFVRKSLVLALGLASMSPANAALVNGSFENGLTGWTTTVFGGASPVTVASGSTVTDAGTLNPSLSGDNYIYTSQGSPGSSFITQDFTVASGTNKVFFDIAIENGAGSFVTPDSLDYSGGANQQARFDILKPGAALDSLDPADIIVSVYRTEVGDAASQDWQTIAVDVTTELSAYVGQDVIFRFAQVDNQMFFNLALDNINVGETQLAQLLSALASAMNQGNAPGYQAAGVIDNNPELQALFNALAGDDQAISNGVTQTLPLLTGGSFLAARSALYGMNGAVKARQDANRGLSSGDPLLSDKHFWIKPFGTWTDQDDRKGVSGFDAKTGGLILGLDASINDQTNLGVAFAYANSNVDGNSSVAPHSLDVDSYQLVGYGSRDLNANTRLNFQADIGVNKNDGQRVIALNNSTASSDYNSYTAHLGAGLARDYAINDSNRVTAAVTADYTWIKDKAYTETGAGLLNLAVESNTAEALVLGVEGLLTHSLKANTDLNVKLGLGYDVINDQASITSAYVGAPGAQFTTYGIDPSPWIANAGVGVVHTTESGVDVSVNYDAEYRSDYLSHSASLKLRWAF